MEKHKKVPYQAGPLAGDRHAISKEAQVGGISVRTMVPAQKGSELLTTPPLLDAARPLWTSSARPAPPQPMNVAVQGVAPELGDLNAPCLTCPTPFWF